MVSIIDSLRDVIGTPDFLDQTGSWDYGAMIEYFVAALLLVVVVSSIFRILVKVFAR